VKYFTTISFFLFLGFIHTNAQGGLRRLKSKLLSADSVIIVSHENTAAGNIIDEKTGDTISGKLLVNGRPNERIIHEKVTLHDSATRKLSRIMARHFQDSVSQVGRCFIPHHAVILFKKGKASFVDLCFGCHSIEATKNIKVTSNDFDSRKWKELIAFYRQHNIQYQMPEPTTTQ
jgi:hypothetical protein